MLLPFHNTKLKHWNPGAEMPLILPVHVICNTSDEEIFENIRANSRRPGKWVSLQREHDGVAVLCGSGPSLSDSLEEIQERQRNGAWVFAMNGAAKFLWDHGIMPDYQVLIDARPQTAGLVGPAREHLFASQVHPKCFEKKPNAKVWHLQIGDIEKYLPEYDADYCLVGGAASVGNTATCLAYSLGYRELHLYGYDSSHRENRGHAFPQPMNDGDPCAIVEFNGKQYTASLTMKLQAERFMETSKALREMGAAIHVHGDGLLPDIYNAPKEALTEVEKYQRVWGMDAYRDFAPGEECAELFLRVAQPHGQQVIDFGCGTGRGALKISKCCPVLCVDFADNCRDESARHLPFLLADLTKPVPASAPFGYCTDVMEHIPPEGVAGVIRNVMASAKTAFFQISTVPDVMGELINQDLHLTVRPHGWWRDLFTSLGYSVQWEQERENAALFLIRSDSGPRE